MMIIKFSAYNQRLRRITSGPIPLNSYGKVKFEFDFRTDDWNAATIKTANFTYDGNNYYIDLDKHNQCFVPKEVIYSPSFSVAVYGGDIITNMISIPTEEKKEMKPNVYAEIIKLIEEHTHEEYVEHDEIDGLAAPKPFAITLYGGDAWKPVEGFEKRYIQDITQQLAGKITVNSKIDIQPTPEQLYMFQAKDVTFTTVNDGGNVRVCAIGERPVNDYENIQITITEVSIDE